MYINELIIDNYRNYDKQHLTFSPYYNFIIGDNGQGKTNLIEAIYLLGIAKSFRISTDKDLIRKGQDYFYLKGIFFSEEDEGTSQSIEIGYNKQKKNTKYNGIPHKKISDWIGKLKTVVFLNQDIELILGSSSERRKYMDIVISISNHNYLVNLQQYLKVLKNRNKCLKDENAIFDLYDEQLIDFGSKIIYERMLFFNDIKEPAKELFVSINPDITNFNLEYRSTLGKLNDENIQISVENIKNLYSEVLEKNRSKDILYKRTLTGPHLDDFNIKSNREIFKRFASQGQNRVGALTLKMIAIKHIEKVSNQKVILLLDDILLDLDATKKNYFLNLVKEHQCFFTSTNTYGVGDISKFATDSRMFTVNAGQISVE